MEIRVNRDALAQELDESGEIQESFSIIRKDRFDKEVVVVYVVPAALTLANAARLAFAGIISRAAHGGDLPGPARIDPGTSSRPPVQLVPVNSIPRDDSGAVDVASLEAMAVPDNGLVDDWLRAVCADDRIDRAAVFGVLNRRKVEYLHCEGFFRSAGWTTGPSGAPAGRSRKANAMTADSSAAGVSPVRALAGTQGKLLVDRLDGKYGLSLASTLYRAVETSPQKGIRYIDRAGNLSFQSYPELLESALALLAGLQARGLQAGDKVLLQCDDNRDFLGVFWACVLGAMVPVPMTVAPVYSQHNAAAQKLLNAWRNFERPVIVCSDALADGLGRLYAEADLPAQTVLSCTQLLDSGAGAAPKTASEIAPDALALLLLTSGSTGTPKAVMHTHQTLINRSAASSSCNGFGGEDISLNWMPLDHVGGIVMFHLRDVYNACSQVQVATPWVLENPLRWLDAIDSERASVTWAPNFAFALVVDQADEIAGKDWDLSCMRFMLNGGEAVVARTARNFLRLLWKYGLPQDSMHPAWGMSETASGVCYSHDFTAETRPDSGNCVEVGRPIANTELRIVDAENRVLNEGETGNLQVKGASVTPGYYRNPEANRQAFTEDGWFDTGDAGMLRNGRLTITARVKDEIIVNGVNHPAAEIETLVESVPGIEISFTAACAVRRTASDTDALAIFCCPTDCDLESLARLLATIRETVSAGAGVNPEFVIPLSRPQIPKTSIGKIQRGLLREKFERGEFDQELEKAERLLGTRVIPGWFYEKVWRPKKLTAPPLPGVAGRNCYLVCCDGAGFAAGLAPRLSAAGARVVTVSIADGYECRGKDAYGVDPDSRSDFARLMRALREAKFYPDVVLHCWTYAETAGVEELEDFGRAQRPGINGLINLLRALAEFNRAANRVRLFVVGADVQQYLRARQSINPHAATLGLLKTLPHEIAWLSARHLDFSFYRTQQELAQQVDAVVDEIAAGSQDDEILYRNGIRYGWQLSPQVFAAGESGTCPIEAGGLILVAGGLGGVGSILARFLIKKFDARLILAGRSLLPERASWPDTIRRGGKLAERISRYLEIEALGGEFVYAVADVSDFDALQAIVDRAERRWGKPLNAVFHLAAGGEIGARSVVDDDPAGREEMFSAKVRGGLALARLVNRRERAIMVSFGSAIGLFGEARYAAYTAAHSLLEQVTRRFDRDMPGRFFQFDWAAWENNPPHALEYFKSRGYSTIAAQAGMNSLLLALCGGRAHSIIGLDADNWSVRKRLAFESRSLLRLVCCFTAREGHSAIESSLGSSEIPDRFGRRSQCEFLQLERMPETADGEIDIRALQAMVDDRSGGKDELPASALERQIAALWSELLAIDEPGRHSSFFRLGGSSISAMRLISRLNEAFDIRLEMRDLFDACTLADMALLVDSRRTRGLPGGVRVAPDAKTERDEPLNARELLANIDRMSEEEVASLLEKITQQDETR